MSQPAKATSEASPTEMVFFYKNPSPERAARVLSGFDTAAPQAGPSSLIGFLTAVFQKYPDQTGKIIPSGLSPAAIWVTAAALHMAGQDNAARPLLDQLIGRGLPAPELAHMPANLDAVQTRGADEFDLLWGASFATGNPRYCAKILSHFAAVANAGEAGKDMVTIVKWMTHEKRRPGDMQGLLDRLGPEKLRILAEESSALWSLHANAQRHDFVRGVVDAYIKAHPREPASKALLALGAL